MATSTGYPARPSLIMPPGPVRPVVEPDRRPLAVVLARFGGPEGFAVSERPLQAIAPGDVRVRVLAASVQLTDVLVRTGKFAPADLDRGVVPDAVIDSVVDLPEWWRTATAR